MSLAAGSRLGPYEILAAVESTLTAAGTLVSTFVVNRLPRDRAK